MTNAQYIEYTASRRRIAQNNFAGAAGSPSSCTPQSPGSNARREASVSKPSLVVPALFKEQA